jgi:hypothetical protein
MTGIISAIGFCSDYSGLYAAGSFSGSVGLYDEDVDRVVGFLDNVHPGGVTQVGRCSGWSLTAALMVGSRSRFTLYRLLRSLWDLGDLPRYRCMIREIRRSLLESWNGQERPIKGCNLVSIHGADGSLRVMRYAISPRCSRDILTRMQNGVVRIWELSDLAAGPVFQEQLHEGKS